MCLLIAKPAGESIPLEHLENAAKSNPHGAGIAWHDGKRVCINRAPDKKPEELAETLDKLTGCPAIIHFRYATHGSINKANTHPFRLANGGAMAHNGVIHDLTHRKDESDTRAFIRQVVNPLLSHGFDTAGEDFLLIVSRAIEGGGKLAFLSPIGELSIACEELGEWDGGSWYSNDSYLPWIPLPKRKYSLLKSDHCTACGLPLGTLTICPDCMTPADW